MLTVEKIGGTSMSRFHELLNSIFRTKRERDGYYNRIFIVSAYNNVTNWLLEHKKTGEPGVYEQFARQADYKSALDQVLTKLIDINKLFHDLGLDQTLADAAITARIQKTKDYLDSMADVLASGYVDRASILLAAREILASIGEAHSAFNSVEILRTNGLNATLVDLSGFNDSEYLSINERIHRALKNIDFSQTITIVTGYTKGTEGIMREFDRGYSEVTFSKVAVEVKAHEAIIHKEYHLSSADPNIVGIQNSIPVGFTNYDVADQLADIGMEAIHPKASKPLEIAGIDLRIKNAFEPEHPGTLITQNYIGPKAKVEMIAGTDKVVVIEIHDPNMVGEVGFDMGLMKLFASYQISYIMKATNANSISVVIWDNESGIELIKELKKVYRHITMKKSAIVCAIGSNIAIPGVLVKAAQALSAHSINIECMSQSLRQVNMQFVIDRKHFKNAIIALNDILCLNG